MQARVQTAVCAGLRGGNKEGDGVGGRWDSERMRIQIWYFPFCFFYCVLFSALCTILKPKSNSVPRHKIKRRWREWLSECLHWSNLISLSNLVSLCACQHTHWGRQELSDTREEIQRKRGGWVMASISSFNSVWFDPWRLKVQLCCHYIQDCTVTLKM